MSRRGLESGGRRSVVDSGIIGGAVLVSCLPDRDSSVLASALVM